MRSLVERLALARDAHEVHLELVEGLRMSTSASGIHLMPLAPVAGRAAAPVLHVRDHDPEEVAPRLAVAVAALHEELDTPDPFVQPGRVLRLERALGWERWRGSSAYQEHFRSTESARQLVLGVVDGAGAPRAFVAVCRGEREEDFTSREVRQLRTMRDAGERALRAFDLGAQWSAGAGAVLDALTQALPIPALLMDARGGVLWMNREAEIRLRILSLRFGSRTVFGATPALDELADRVRAELDAPGASLVSERPSWLEPGEALVIRRLEDGDAAPRALVSLVPGRAPRPARSVDELREAHSLSRREAEVALLASEGYSVLNIACRLELGESTVRTYLKRLYAKLRVGSRVELLRRVSGDGEG